MGIFGESWAYVIHAAANGGIIKVIEKEERGDEIEVSVGQLTLK